MAKKPKFTNGDDNVNLGGGNDTANAKGGNDVVSGGSGDDKINGGAGNDFLRGGAGDDRLNGGEGDDRLAGGAGDDTLLGGKGTNKIDGGEGDDLVILDGDFKDAKVVKNVDGSFTITTANGVNTVSNVETFQFADGFKDASELVPTPPGTGKTISLTVNSDGPGAVAPAVDTTGTDLDDTYISATGTLTTADVIDGKLGADTLTFRDAAATTTNVAPKISNVETINVTGLNSDAAGGTTLDLISSSGVKTLISSDGTGDVTFKNVASAVDLQIKGTKVTAANLGDQTLTYAGTVLAGAADTQKIAFDTAAARVVTVSAGAETLAVNLTAGTSFIEGLVSGAKTVTFEGAGGIGISNFTTGALSTLTGATTVEASKAAGGVSFAIDSALTVAATGGAGADTIGAAGLDAADKLDGGAGTDIVSFATGGALPAAKITNVVNFEGVQIEANSGGTINVDNFSGSTLTNFILGTGADQVDGLVAATATITNGVTGSTITQYDYSGPSGVVNFALKTDGAADVLTYNMVNVDNTGAVDTHGLGTLSATGIETLNLNFKQKVEAGVTYDADTLTIQTLTAAATTKIVLAADVDVILGDTANTLTSLTTFDASTATKNVKLGDADTAFGTAITGATFTTGTGTDYLHLDVGNAILKAIDLGGQSATSAGDTLVLKGGGVLVGATVVDLSSATDQITQLINTPNADIQKGIENIDLSGLSGSAQITGSASANTIVGTALADTIAAGAGNDVVTGGAGANNISLGAGLDTYVENHAGAGAVVDTITDFTAGAGGDEIDLDISALETAGGSGINANATNFTKLNSAADGADVVAGDVTIQELVADGVASNVNAGNADLFIFTGATLANAAAVATALETGGDTALQINAADDVVWQSFLVVYSDGTNAYLAAVTVDTVTANDANFEAGDLTVTNLVNLGANPSITAGEFTAANFDWIA